MSISPDIAGVIARVAAGLSVGPAALLAMAARLLENPGGLAAPALERQLRRNGADLLALRAALARPTGDAVVDQARLAAAAVLAEGRFGEADRSLAKAELHLLGGLSDLSAMGEALRLAAGGLRGERGGIALLTLGPRGGREAAQRFAEAAALVGLADRERGNGYALSQGEALLRAGADAGDAGLLAEAIAHFRRLLQGLDNFEETLAWGAVQERLAAALVARAELDGARAGLEEAAACCRTALEDVRQAQAPALWFALQRRLGGLALRLAPGAGDVALAEEAVEALRAALSAGEAGLDAEDLATLRFDLAQALALLGARDGGMAALEAAFNTFEQVIRHWTREARPGRWAETQDRMGGVLVAMAQRYSEPVILEEAVAAYGAAVEMRPRAKVPALWAASTAGQGMAMAELARRQGDAALGQKALAQIMAAVECLRGAGQAQAALDWQKKLVAAAAALGALTKR